MAPVALQVTMVISNLFTLEDMTLSPDLETDLSEYLIRRFADLGAIEQVRVLRKAPGGVATAKFRQPDAAQAALLRASATVMIWGMFAAPEMAARGDARAAEVAEDVAERAAALGVGLAGEGAVAVMRGSGAGACAVGCADIAGMQRLAMGFDGAAYDGRILRAEALEAEMWGAPLLLSLADTLTIVSAMIWLNCGLRWGRHAEQQPAESETQDMPGHSLLLLSPEL